MVVSKGCSESVPSETPARSVAAVDCAARGSRAVQTEETGRTKVLRMNARCIQEMTWTDVAGWTRMSKVFRVEGNIIK